MSASDDEEYDSDDDALVADAYKSADAALPTVNGLARGTNHSRCPNTGRRVGVTLVAARWRGRHSH